MLMIIGETRVRNARSGKEGVYMGSMENKDGKTVVMVQFPKTNHPIPVDSENIVGISEAMCDCQDVEIHEGEQTPINIPMSAIRSDYIDRQINLINTEFHGDPVGIEDCLRRIADNLGFPDRKPGEPLSPDQRQSVLKLISLKNAGEITAEVIAGYEIAAKLSDQRTWQAIVSRLVPYRITADDKRDIHDMADVMRAIYSLHKTKVMATADLVDALARFGVVIIEDDLLAITGFFREYGGQFDPQYNSGQRYMIRHADPPPKEPEIDEDYEIDMDDLVDELSEALEAA